EFTWKTGIDWFWREENMLYFTASTGFLAGGFNRFTPIATSPVQSVFYQPETILNFEWGSKNRFLDDRLQLNALIFYNEITDQQVYTFDTSVPSSVIDNSGSSETFGVEIEMQAIPTDQLFITATLAYIDAYYVEWDGFSDGFGTFVNVADNKRITSPEWTGGITASYEIPLGDMGTLTPHIQFAFKDDYWVTPLNDPFLDKQKAYTQTDLRLLWEDKNGHWNAEAFVQNIENEFPLNGAFFAFGGMWTSSGPEPRTYGIKIGYNY
ncbi:MAG: TonB-dependent receptor, partial [Gammaproteobacteria bacterium]|nr:TonB-dependent receptor [Gammaproteobacteria bacterium]